MSEAGLQINVGGKLELALGQLESAIEKLTSNLADVITYTQPIAYSPIGTNVADGTTNLNTAGFGVFSLGGPEIGQRWNIKRLGVSTGFDVTAAMSGRADFYSASVMGVQALPFPSIGWKRAFLALPNTEFITDNGITVIAPANLIVVISGGPVSTSVLVTAEIEVIPDTARTASVTTL